jgi:glycosyltransferase involved in cell wall biosynthesis
VVVLDNVIPHEPHFFDKPLTKYFLNGCTGFVSMSESVENDLLSLRPDAPHILKAHPLYSHFGAKLPKDEACRSLGIPSDKKTLLFFGLIREYKGLDILLEAFRELPEEYQILVAGEPYGSFEKYQEIIDTLPGKDRVHLFTDYVRDSEVKKFFSASDLAVLPYRSATQSGISSVALNFDLPMVVTDVGGLASTIGSRGTGIVAPTPAPGAIREEILRYFGDASLQESCRDAIGKEKQRLGWDTFCSRLTDFAATL